MISRHLWVAILAALAFSPPLRAGLYYSGETYAELPSHWRGFLLDQRLLRGIGLRPAAGSADGPVRKLYLAEAERLTKRGKELPLTADEAADLGALYVRLGEPARAVEVLRSALRDHPEHHRLAANLGTAWQLHGDLAQSAACLQRAARLAPEHLRPTEELHLKLVRLRARHPRETQQIDDLFGVRFVGPGGKFEPGKLAEEQRRRLPPDAVARVQRLALWLPADGRLLWLLAELAGANGDFAAAAAMLDGCVTEFGLRSAELLEHRRAFRAAAEDRTGGRGDEAKKQHEGHTPLFKPRSQRPLVRKTDSAALPPVDPRGVNALPWSVLTETTIDRQYRPTFPHYLRQLDGKQVKLSGYLQPLGDDADFSAFLLVEYPVGCWYCEQPEMTGIVLVELPDGKSYHFTRGQVHIRGKLLLNARDPENFLYTIRDAEVSQPEEAGAGR